MLLAGYNPVDPNALNWEYYIKLKDQTYDHINPFFQWSVKRFRAEESARGDLVRLMMHDEKFPTLAHYKVVSRHIKSLDPSEEAAEALEEMWSEFSKDRDRVIAINKAWKLEEPEE